MGQGISEVLPFAIGVAIVPIPIIAVIVILFSSHARVNGPVFLLGWVIGLSVAFAVAFVLADASDIATDETASDSISWLKVLLGIVLLLLAARTWRKRPAPGVERAMPKWMSGIDTLAPGKALGVGGVLAAANPKNLILVVGAATGVAGLGLATGDVIVSAVVFVVVASLSVGAPVVYYLVGGESATSSLEEVRVWLIAHNEAVMTVLFLVFGVILISKGLAPLTD